MPAPDMPHSPGEHRPHLPPAPQTAAGAHGEEAHGKEAHDEGGAEAAAVPRQGRRADGVHEGAHNTAPDDALDHPDPWAAADACATENLLRCWARESGVVPPAVGTWRTPLPAAGTALLVPVRHWSATGWHRFGPPALDGGAPDAPALDAVTLAALLGREAAYGPERHSSRATVTELVGRVADSVRNTAQFLSARRATPADPATDTPFLTAEQSLLLGHPLHPTPKSREGLSEAESPLFSPESRGSFPLHWFAVDQSVLARDSAWTERGRTVPAERLALSLAGPDLERPPGTVPLPLHPWQAREIRYRPEATALFDAGLLHDLGPAGEHWHPTSSVRTVYRTGAPAMLKLSLALRITNSRRENLRKELWRGVEVHRLLRSGLSGQWRAACPGRPGFDIVRDPAWLAVDSPDGTPLSGLDVVIRHNPFGPGDEAVCLAGLTALRPWPDRRAMCSRLARIVARIAARTGHRPATVSIEWFLRYLHTVVRPVLWLDGEAGIALEAHQQNTLVLLDPDGWPAGGRYRDNQGYYFRESRRAELQRRLPEIGAHSDTFVSDEVADERFAYYLGVNNVLGLIGAFGSQRLADERLLLAAFRRFLAEAASGPAKIRSTLPASLLEAPNLRCKANLLTRLRGLDELVGPVDTQSVYVTIANPLFRSVTPVMPTTSMTSMA
ncbi:iron transport protein [Streptomyces bingchenggensis BCW-1]|uniref:Iron transport protein n=1 Tax=Streptomyces bingchenggensis (strain BCW-1) TaxID=749414 RepID=D7CA80_STRBB|nr:IucA/IucC family protein [Streptomyces milbemycinicus]ADI06437.1 iron transport protein [Streptomyces bingchenggensis BCW-1]